LDDVNEPIMGGILAGIFRIFKYSNLKSVHFKEHIELLFKISRISSFNVSIEAMRVIFIISSSSNDDEILKSRFYTLLYNKV
jgi:ribosome biogenesis protein MAK21